MPSTLIDARRISRHHGARTLLDAVDLRVDAGSRIALIGPNGSGKSTLLRILAGLERPDGGAVRAHGTVGYLPQLASDTAAGGSATVRDDDPRAHRRRRGAAAGSTRSPGAWRRGDLAAVEPHAAALERWLALGGDDAEARARAAAADSASTPACSTAPLRDAVGRPGGAGRARGAARRRGSTSCCSTSRRTTSTPTASSGSPRCWPSAPAASCSSRTTARCSRDAATELRRARPAHGAGDALRGRLGGLRARARRGPPPRGRRARAGGRAPRAARAGRARGPPPRARERPARAAARRATATRTRRSG